ncbi:hypothetical protein BDV19DRAFT_383869 [Aspergillus venezuelensis]
MGEYTVYCTFCSGPLNNACDIGSHHHDEQRARREWVDRRVYWQTNKSVCFNSDDEAEDVKVERLRMIGMTEEEENKVKKDGQYARDEEEEDSENLWQYYDPELVSPSDVKWLERSAMALGVWDDEVPEDDQTYEDCANAWTVNPHNDPALPHHDERASCSCTWTPAWQIYPFHKECLNAFCRAVQGKVDTEIIDKRALFRAFSFVDDMGRLKLPYGGLDGPEQTWLSTPGEEYAVINPLILSPSTLSELITKSQHDPFRSLPAEVTAMIIDYLPRESIAQVLIASWNLHSRAQTQGFWRRGIHQDMPWAWELQEILRTVDTASLNFGKLYQYLDKASEPRYGMKDKKWLALANRRRIWLPCEILAGLYHKARAGKDPYEVNEEEVFSLDNGEKSGITGLSESEADPAQ